MTSLLLGLFTTLWAVEKSKRQKAEAELAAVKAAKAHVEATSQQTASKNLDLLAQIEGLNGKQVEFERMQAQLVNIKAELAEAWAGHAKLSEENAKLFAETDRLERERTRNLASLRESESKLVQANAENAQLKQSASGLSDELLDSQTQVTDLKAKLADMLISAPRRPRRRRLRQARVASSVNPDEVAHFRDKPGVLPPPPEVKP